MAATKVITEKKGDGAGLTRNREHETISGSELGAQRSVFVLEVFVLRPRGSHYF